jgi:hypothetical protein
VDRAMRNPFATPPDDRKSAARAKCRIHENRGWE